MKKYYKALLILSLLVVPTVSLHAQRTADGMSLLSVSAVSDFTSAGAEISYGEYLLYSYWAAGFSLNHNGVVVNTGEQTEFLRAELYGDWMWRALHTRDRRVNFYLGSGLFIGMERLDPYSRLYSDTYQALLNNGYSSGTFIYGVAPKAELEVFLTDILGVTTSLRMPVTINSQRKQVLGCLSATLSVGFRLNF